MKIIIKSFIILFLVAIITYFSFPLLKDLIKEPDNLIVAQKKLLSNYKLLDSNYIDKGIVLVKGDNEKELQNLYITKDGSQYAFNKLTCQTDNKNYAPEKMYIKNNKYGIGYHISYYIPSIRGSDNEVECYGIIKVVD